MKSFPYHRSLLFCCLFFLLKPAYTQSFTMSGKAPGIRDNSIVTLTYFDNNLNGNKTDTTFIKKGHFVFSGKIIGASNAYLSIITTEGKKEYEFYLILVTGKINVSVKGPDYNKIEVDGSVAHHEYELLQNELLYEKTELKKISDSSNIVTDLLINAIIDDSTAKRMKAIVRRNVPSLYTSELQKQIAFVKTHPNSYASLSIISYFIGRTPDDSLDTWYASLNNRLKGSNMDKDFLKRYLRYRKAISAEYPFDKLQLQEQAPAFAIYQNKDTLGLKDFHGKVVVLELWGLSCIPCLYSNLALEKIRNRYNNEQIKIISLAKTFPGDIEPILSYIKKNKFNNWIHVVLNNDGNEKLGSLLEGDFSKYIGLGIPRTIIIDQGGKLAYKSYGYTDDQVIEVEKLIDKLIREYK